jgi:hypothetical protein
MAILLTFDFPGITRPDVEAVTNYMRVREDPPPGLIFHIATDAPTSRSLRRSG